MVVNIAKLTFAVVTIAVLVTVSCAHEILSRLPAYVRLHTEEPFYVAESIDKIAGVCVCLLAVWLMFRTGVRGVLRVLGLCASIPRALVFALIASFPMLLGFALTRSLTPHLQMRPLLFLTVLSPIVEEIEFRGFGVLQLKNRTGWPFWIVVWPSALLCGYGHVEQGGTSLESAGLFFFLTAGGVTFAWLAQRWQNLWVPVALHVCMNLWWELFSIARTAIGGWFPFILQNTTILLAILITLYYTRAGRQVAILPS
jgi:membrane protease YdiL (CAAX protease family)